MADREWSTLDVEDIAALTAVYGGNPARWPADRRAAAVRALAQDGAAHELVVSEAKLDALLSMVAEPEITAARVDDVVAGALARLEAAQAPAATVVRGRRLETFLPSPFDVVRTALSWLGVRAPQAGWLAGATAAGIMVGVMTLPSATLTAADGGAQTGATVETAQADVTDMPSLLFTSYTVETRAQ
ncbi:hypothetical protein [Azospirillum sp. B4]|uniref:hypothetical protein n=1 Tax=Azospirillum sp. B4 TaxID=95605 RepID=UPI0005C93B77|nr:hypothetical protein [Azospirillum sp. B4]